MSGFDKWLREQARERFPVETWRTEVARGATLLGYEDWLDEKLEAEDEPGRANEL